MALGAAAGDPVADDLFAAAGLGAAAAPQPAAAPRLGDFSTAPTELPQGFGAAAAQVPPVGLGAAAIRPQVPLAQATALPGHPAVPESAPAPAGAKPGIAEQLYLDARAREQALYDAAARVGGSRANPMRPIAEAEAQFQQGVRGPFVPQPLAEVPPIEPGESEFDYQQRIEALQNADLERQFAEYQAGPQLGDVRDIGTTEGPGMGEAQRQAAEGVGETQLAQQERIAQVLQQTAEAQTEATRTAEAADAARRERARAQLDAMETHQEIEDQSRREFMAMPDLDPNRFYKSMTGKNKLFALIGLIGGGLAGVDVAGKLNDYALQDLEAQKASFAQSSSKLGAAEDATTRAASFYQSLLQSAGDEQIADSIWLKRQLEDAAAQLEAEIARTTVPTMAAELQQALVGLQGQIHQEDQRVATLLATTPERIATGGAARRRLIKQAEAAGERAQGLEDVMIGRETMVGEEAIKQEGRLELEGAKTKTEINKGVMSDSRSQAAAHAKDVAKMQAANTILIRFIKKAQSGDVAGRGLDAYFATEEGRNVREEIKEAQRRQLRFESQGVIGEDEIEDRVNSMMSGWGDNELISNAQRLVDANNAEITAREYGMTEEARQIYYRNPNLAPLERRGASLSSDGVDADAAALGGRVVR